MGGTAVDILDMASTIEGIMVLAVAALAAALAGVVAVLAAAAQIRAEMERRSQRARKSNP